MNNQEWAATLAVSWAAAVLLIWASFPRVRHGPQDPEPEPEPVRTYTTHHVLAEDGNRRWWVVFHGKDAVAAPFGPFATEDEATEHGEAGAWR